MRLFDRDRYDFKALLIWDTRKNKLYGDQDGTISGCSCSCPLTGDRTSSACICGCVVNGVSATAATCMCILNFSQLVDVLIWVEGPHIHIQAEVLLPAPKSVAMMIFT